MKMLSLGIDIGGANTKAVLFIDGVVEDNFFNHIPLWKGTDELLDFLENLQESIKPDVVGVTMTAELCDVFDSKVKGAKKIVEKAIEIFKADKIYFFSKEGDLLSSKEALNSPKYL